MKLTEKKFRSTTNQHDHQILYMLDRGHKKTTAKFKSNRYSIF